MMTKLDTRRERTFTLDGQPLRSPELNYRLVPFESTANRVRKACLYLRKRIRGSLIQDDEIVFRSGRGLADKASLDATCVRFRWKIKGNRVYF